MTHEMTDLAALEEKFKQSITGLNSMWEEVKSTVETAEDDSNKEFTKLNGKKKKRKDIQLKDQYFKTDKPHSDT